MSSNNVGKFGKRLYILGIFFSVLAILCAVLESVKYPGFIYKHLSIKPFWIYLLTGLFIKIFPPPNPDEFFFSKLFRLLSIVSISISGFLLILEMVNYPNYVFSTFHIHLEGIQILTILFFIYFVLTNLLHSDLVSIVRTTLFISAITLFFNYSFANIISTSTLVKKELSLMGKSGKTDFEKQVSGWGDIYLFANILKRQTPPNSIIALPPAQNHWLYSGNLVLMRYFLYPRELVNVKETDSELTLYQMPDVPYEYVAIVWGESNLFNKAQYGWPKVQLSSEYIEYFQLPSNEVVRIYSDQYEPNNELNSLYKWGVIKTK